MVEKKKIQIPRGLKDVLPEEQKYWFHLENNFYDVAAMAGFDRIILPTFEFTELFKRSVGELTDIVSKEMYSFKDRSGHNVTLRPEGTAGVARAYIEHGMHTLPQPVKLYYFGPMFRYDRPQAGRYREFYQYGLEILGEDDPIADAILIQTAVRFYQKLGLTDFVVKINSLGSDKSKNKMVAVLAKFLNEHKSDLCSDCKLRMRKNPLRVMDCKIAGCKALLDSASSILIDSLDEESKKRFTKVLEHLDEMKVEYELDPTLVRGLDYYTHTLFEVVLKGSDLAICGGGRYDNLIKQLGGPITPAIGFAGGVERTIEALKTQEAIVPDPVKAELFIVQLGERAKSKAADLFEKFDTANFRVASSMGRGNIQSQLSEANKLNCPLVIIIGDQEVHDKNVIVRDMKDRSQETVIDRDVIKIVSRKLEEKGIRIS
ncbi:histidine--tRNA ligase [Patescibacteria group bacterium]|nr:histidine--tRNA ligase [Patescibacteria group bacterium]